MGELTNMMLKHLDNSTREELDKEYNELIYDSCQSLEEIDIEERALEKYPVFISEYSDSCEEYDSNESDRLTYIEGATDQHKIDIEKADRWLRTHLPRVITYYPDAEHTIEEMLNEDMREEFIKAMEE